MNVNIVRSITAVAVLLFVSCSGGNKPLETSHAKEAEQTGEVRNTALESKSAPTLPYFAITNVTGNTINLQSFKGKKVFLNLWASWCPPCRREMPSIEKLAQSVDTSKVAFVLLSLDDNFDKARAFIKQQEINLPIYHPAENLPSLFNVQSIPSTLIFDERGTLIHRTDGSDDFDTEGYRTLLK